MSTPDRPDLDQRARRSAARLHDDVVDTVDLAAAERRAKRPSRAPAVVALSVAAIVAVVAAVFLVSPDSGDVEVAIDEDGTTTTEPDAPDADSMPAPIALGAPDDGKDSVGLPVDADPKTGLTDGQVVTVVGAEFPPGQDIGVVMCTREAGAEHGGRGVDACNIGHVGRGTSDAQGNVSIQFSVRRFATLDGQEIDCASDPGRCIIGMGMISDYDQSGGVAIDFDPDVPAPEPPTASLSKTDGIVDGETVDLTVTGLAPNSYIYVSQCSLGGCTVPTGAELVADADGRYSGPIRLWRQFGSNGEAGPGNVDCATEPCHLSVGGDVASGRPLEVVPITFDPTLGERVAPVITVLDEGPFSPGSVFSIEVSGLGEGDFVEASVCPRPGGECIAYGYPQTPSNGGTQVIEVSVDRGDAACATGCPLSVSIFSESAQTGGGPPPLFPEPVMVTITG